MTYDRQLTFSRDAALVGNSLKRQTGAMLKLASTSWGYDHQTLRETYIVTWCSKVEYGASSWLLWISNSMLENLMRSQRYARRAITGQLCTVPIDGILAEANFPLIKTRAIQLSTIAMEKSLKATQINLRRTTATQRVRQRIQKTSWHEKADVRQKIFGGTQPTTTPPLKPPRIDTGTHTLESTGQKTGDATSDHADVGEGLG